MTYRRSSLFLVHYPPPKRCHIIGGTLQRQGYVHPSSNHYYPSFPSQQQQQQYRKASLVTTVLPQHGTNLTLRRLLCSIKNKFYRNVYHNSYPRVDRLPRQLHRTRYFSSNQLLGHSPMSHTSSNSIMNPGGSGAHMGISIPDSKYIPTAYEAMIGNVWQTSTWRRDKILELKGELNALPEVIANKDQTMTLDLLATERQKLDLYLVDGMHLIIKHVEESIKIQSSVYPDSDVNNDASTVVVSSPSSNILTDIVQRMEQMIAAKMKASVSGGSSSSSRSSDMDHLLTESEWNRILLSLQKDIETVLSTTTILQTTHIYHPIRDYMNLDDQNEQHKKLLENEDFFTFLKEQNKVSNAITMNVETSDDNITKSSQFIQALQQPQMESFHNSVTRYQLILTLAMVQQLQQSWKILTTMTDQDIDRAAAVATTTTTTTTMLPSTDTTTTASKSTIIVAQSSSNSRSIPVKKLIQLVQAYLIPNHINDTHHESKISSNVNDRRMEALWTIMDKDNDGLIDQVEMNQICTIAVTATQNAIRQFVKEVIDVVPMDHLSHPLITKDDTVTNTTNTKNKVGWRQRRRIRNEKAAFIKRLNYVLQNHFDNELEISHRLRCIYSWSNKQHQNNRINSILVQEDDSGIVTSVVGRKRYVELYPKIAIEEFREVQRIHFPQLDGIGQEYMKSLREELWILQGKGRQNRELQRDCTLFMVGVCILDYIVLSL